MFLQQNGRWRTKDFVSNKVEDNEQHLRFSSTGMHKYMCIHTYTLIKKKKSTNHSNTEIHKKLDPSPIIIGKDHEQVLYTSTSDKNEVSSLKISLAVTTHICVFPHTNPSCSTLSAQE